MSLSRKVLPWLLGALGLWAAGWFAPSAVGADFRDPARSTGFTIPAEALLSLPAVEAAHALLPATREEALPDGYVPPDLVPLVRYGLPEVGRQQIREVVVPDLWEMVQAARADGMALRVISGYRSYDVQAYTYNNYARRWGTEVADQRSARPGHSQHQLGTAMDFNQLSQLFVVSPEGQWLWAHGHEYGFIFPYTAASVSRTGYISEPWHVRWVGRDIARAIWETGYLDSEAFDADDLVAEARLALNGQLGKPL
jgi:zinc D-Ala-D-Ala carboxypeptidase